MVNYYTLRHHLLLQLFILKNIYYMVVKIDEKESNWFKKERKKTPKLFGNLTLINT
jgi:hypothetical protein